MTKIQIDLLAFFCTYLGLSTFNKDRTIWYNVTVKRLKLLPELVFGLTVLAALSVLTPPLPYAQAVIFTPKVCYFTESPPPVESLSADPSSACFDVPTDTALSALTAGNSTGALQILKSTQQKLSTLSSSPGQQLENTSASISSLQSNLAASIDAIEKGNTTEASNILTGKQQKFPPAPSQFN